MYFLGVLRVPSRVAFVLMIGVLACEAAPPRTAGSIEPSEPSEPSEQPLPQTIEIAGLLPSPERWPAPVPTIWADGALSIRALRLDPNALLASAEAGEVVRLRAFVQGNEPREGDPLRTWLVDRAIDLDRLDQGMPVEPALPAMRSGARIQLVARLERRELTGIAEPMLVVAPLAWLDEDSEAWQPIASTVLEPRPPEAKPSPLLRRATDERPLALADDLDHALQALASAALADDGALAERHARRALELDANNVEVWSTLIALYHGYGHHDHHLAALQAASARGLVELDPLWLAYGSLDVELGEFAHAIALLDQALARAPESLAANFYLATAHWLLGDHAAAEPGYAKVVELGAVHEATEPRMLATAQSRLAELRAEPKSKKD